jgi:hypothetical protein
MKKMYIFSVVLSLIVMFIFTALKINAQECSYSDYILDVESKYNKDDQSISLTITNPKPILSDGKSINLTSMKISVYNGDGMIKEETYNNVSFASGEKKTYKMNNLPDSFGTEIVSIVVTGQISGSYNVGFGSIINVGLNLPSGLACGDDVLTN